MIINPYSFATAGGGGSVTITFQSAAAATPSDNAYTFTSLAIGAPEDRDHVIVLIQSQDSSNGTSCTGVTIGGVTATLIAQHNANYSTSSATQSFWYAVVPSGTTANVVATMSTTMLNCSCAVWTDVGVSSFTAYDTGTYDSAGLSSATFSGSVDTPSGDSVVIGAAMCRDGGATVTGITSDSVQNSELTWSAGSAVSSSASTYTMTVDPVSTSTQIQRVFLISLQ
jgi:hypothetical protein